MIQSASAISISAKALLSLLLVILVIKCRGDCMPTTPTISEQLEELDTDADADGGTLIARLTFARDEGGVAKTVSTNPCSFEVYEDGYVYAEEVPLYTVAEIFRGPHSFSVGDEIPILWNTDTGYRLLLPSPFDEDDGFLGRMTLVDSCYIDGKWELPYPSDTASVWPFSMGECNFSMNRPWSAISEADRLILRGDDNSTGSSGKEDYPSVSNATTTTSEGGDSSSPSTHGVVMSIVKGTSYVALLLPILLESL